MTGEAQTKDWAGTTLDTHDLHRFDQNQQALCDPTIRTYAKATPDDATREPYMYPRSRAQIEATGFASGRWKLYRFCPDCAGR